METKIFEVLTGKINDQIRQHIESLSDGVAKDFEEALKWALLAQKNGKETEETIIWLKQMILVSTI